MRIKLLDPLTPLLPLHEGWRGASTCKREFVPEFRRETFIHLVPVIHSKIREQDYVFWLVSCVHTVRNMTRQPILKTGNKRCESLQVHLCRSGALQSLDSVSPALFSDRGIQRQRLSSTKKLCNQAIGRKNALRQENCWNRTQDIESHYKTCM